MFHIDSAVPGSTENLATGRCKERIELELIDCI